MLVLAKTSAINQKIIENDVKNIYHMNNKVIMWIKCYNILKGLILYFSPSSFNISDIFYFTFSFIGLIIIYVKI